MFTRLARHARVWRSLVGDKRTPFMTKALPWAALAYFLLPIDLVPDFLPLIGEIDDIGMVILLVSIALRLIPKDLWKEHGEKIKRKDVIDI